MMSMKVSQLVFVCLVYLIALYAMLLQVDYLLHFLFNYVLSKVTWLRTSCIGATLVFLNLDCVPHDQKSFVVKLYMLMIIAWLCTTLVYFSVLKSCTTSKSFLYCHIFY